MNQHTEKKLRQIIRKLESIDDKEYDQDRLEVDMTKWFRTHTAPCGCVLYHATDGNMFTRILTPYGKYRIVDTMATIIAAKLDLSETEIKFIFSYSDRIDQIIKIYNISDIGYKTRTDAIDRINYVINHDTFRS